MMTAANQSGSHKPAPTGVILKTEHRPHTIDGEFNTHILLKGHPLPSPLRDASIHHTTSPELKWREKYCIYCQQCQLVCPRGCLHQTEDGLEIDRDACTTCGTCVKQCPSMALEVVGAPITAAELLHQIFDQNYAIARNIKHVTIGGGEPGMQSDFCADLLFQLSAKRMPTTLQTTGTAHLENYLPLIPYPAIIHYELISTDSTLHDQICGYGNETIMENLLRISEAKPTHTFLVIRTPLLRGQNTSSERILQTSSWLKAHFPLLPKWEIFEPTYACEHIHPLSMDEFGQIYAHAAGNYPADLVQLFNRNERYFPVPH